MRDSRRGRKRTTEGLWRLSQSQSAGMSLTPPEEAVNWSAPLREREKRGKKKQGGGWRKSAFAEDVWRPIYSCKDTGRARPALRVPAHSNELCLYTPKECLKIKTILEGRASVLLVHHHIHLLTFSAFAYWRHRPCFRMYCTVQPYQCQLRLYMSMDCKNEYTISIKVEKYNQPHEVTPSLKTFEMAWWT